MWLKPGMLVSLVVFLGLLFQAHSVSFTLEPDVRKCVREEVHKDVLVVGEYRVSDVEGQNTDLMVRSVASCL